MFANRFTGPFCALALAMIPAFAAQSAEETTSVRIPTVTVAQVSRNEMIVQTPVTGTLVPVEEVHVNTKINGLAIEQVLVEVGDPVKIGDVLLVLDERTQAAQLTQSNAEMNRAEASKRQAHSQIDTAEASLKQAEAAFERATSLKSTGNISQALFDQALNTLAAARAGLASAQDGFSVTTSQINVAKAMHDLNNLQLSHTQLRATVAGLISARAANVGAIAVSGGDPLFVIIKDGLIEVEVEVIETSLGGLSVGNATEFEVAGIGTVTGKVRLISPTVDPRTRLGKVRVSLSPVDGLRAGLFASGWITVDQYQALTVPIRAVLSDAEGTYVQVVADEQIEQRRVTAGQIWQGQREIISGVTEGEVVMARAGAFFRDGDRVRTSDGEVK